MRNLIREEVLALQPYVAGKPIDEVKREFNIERVIKLASNENPYGPSKKAIEAIKNTTKDALLYPDSASYDLKGVIASKLLVSREMIFTGAGSDSLIKDICATFLNKGDESIIGEVTFPRYETNTLLFGGVVKKIPLKENKLDIEGMVKAINDKTKIIWFCNPNNPTGNIFTKTEFEKVLDKIPSTVIIIMDEAYIEFKDTDDFPNSLELLKSRKNMIVLRTFSKAYGLASLRVGYGIAHREIVEYLNRVINPFDTNLFAQKAAYEAFLDEEHLEYVVKSNKKEREYYIREFKMMGLRYLDSHTNFIMVDVNGDDKPIYQYLLERGFIIRPGFLLGMSGFVRISIGKSEDNKELMELLEEAMVNRDRT